MTCIVGIEDDSGVTIGGDSAASTDSLTATRLGPKVFRAGPYLIGYTSSFRMGDLLQYAFTPPEPPRLSGLDRHMVTVFIDAVRECFDDGGFSRRSDNAEAGGEFLVAVSGRLYEICSDYQVGRPRGGYAAVGSGGTLALGSLATTAAFKMTTRDRVTAALTAASIHDPFVSPPFTIRTLKRS